MDALPRELDHLVCRLAEAARLLPALVASNAHRERSRLEEALKSGKPAIPRWEGPARQLDRVVWRWLDRARLLAPSAPGALLYLARLEELELELRIMELLGQSKRVRPLAERRYGTGRQLVPVGTRRVAVAQVAAHWLRADPGLKEPQTVPACAQRPAVSLQSAIEDMAQAAGLELCVQVEPRLAAFAAAGDGVIVVSDRAVSATEALRLAAHEVLGHLTAAANAQRQPLQLLRAGTAGSFTDQEGLAIFLEEQAGVLTVRRLRTLSARVVVTDAMHEGAEFQEIAKLLVCEHGFDCSEAVVLCERAFRGGGVARDAVYLNGWLRVRHAVSRGAACLPELRMGRVGVSDLPVLRQLCEEGMVRQPFYDPSLERSLRATGLGTSLETSPPSEAASFTRLELT